MRVGDRFVGVIDRCSKDLNKRVGDVKMTFQGQLEDSPEVEDAPNRKDEDLKEPPDNVKEITKLERADIKKLGFKDIDKLYEKVVIEGKCASYDKIPKSNRGAHILSWACDGSSFVFQPPCLRCQSMYSTWFLFNRPQSSAERRKTLYDHLFSATVAFRETKESDPCSYCAETVAAGKLYVLRNGTLSLV